MNLLNNITAKNILVIGDIMLDTYYTGEVNRISPEAPVPVFRKRNERSVLGGAGNVATNLVAAGQNVQVMSIIGDDGAGKRLKDLMDKSNIGSEFIIALNRHTTEKTRFLASNNQQVIRLDVEDTDPLPDDMATLLVEKLERRIKDFDLVLISDYMKGLLTYDFTQSIIGKFSEKNIPVIIDVKDKNISKYVGATLLKPNLKELCELTGIKVESDDEIIAASEKMQRETGAKFVLTTCGSRGMVLVGDDKPYFKDAVGQEVFDVTGAGDTAIAYVGACMANGMSMQESVDIANIAAGIQVSKVGTSAVYLSEIREKMAKEIKRGTHKLVDRLGIENFRKEHKNQKIVFTNGCFDILHIGHIRYLDEARRLGDILIVGLNSDESVKRLKGLERPINSEEERAEMLGALGFVDYVAIFDEDTPLELIKKIRPDILVKGGDYSNEYIVGTNEVESSGGRVVILPFVNGKSTSNIIERIRK